MYKNKLRDRGHTEIVPISEIFNIIFDFHGTVKFQVCGALILYTVISFETFCNCSRALFKTNIDLQH